MSTGETAHTSGRSTATPAIVAAGLGKTYRIYNGHGRGWVKSLLLPFWKDRFSTTQEALSGIDMRVERGEIIGILGRNGSGKSTLLRLLAGISAPTVGTVRVNGQVRCLLATGINFDPRFTGRENIVYGSAAMGISTRTARERIDQIIEFSELGDAIDKPTMFYSSGMLTKLVFAVAFQETPEILLLDEAMSAGDIFFHHKVDQRVKEIVSSGSTVVLATHSMDSVEQLCTRALLLEQGRVIAEGPPPAVAGRYREMLVEAEAERPRRLASGLPTGSPTSDTPVDERSSLQVELIDAWMSTADGVRTDTFDHGGPLELHLRFRGVGELPMLRIALDIISEDFAVRVANTGTEHLSAETGKLAVFPIRSPHGEHEFVLRMPSNPFGSGLYSWTVAIRAFDPRISTTEYLRQSRVAPFRSVSFPGHPLGEVRRMLTEPEVILELDPGRTMWIEHQEAGTGQHA